MTPGRLFAELTPQLRVATAVTPFVVALLVRVLLGRSLFTRWLITISTMWFMANIMLAPYSLGMRQDLMRLPSVFH